MDIDQFEDNEDVELEVQISDLFGEVSLRAERRGERTGRENALSLIDSHLKEISMLVYYLIPPNEYEILRKVIGEEVTLGDIQWVENQKEINVHNLIFGKKIYLQDNSFVVQPTSTCRGLICPIKEIIEKILGFDWVSENVQQNARKIILLIMVHDCGPNTYGYVKFIDESNIGIEGGKSRCFWWFGFQGTINEIFKFKGINAGEIDDTEQATFQKNGSLFVFKLKYICGDYRYLCSQMGPWICGICTRKTGDPDWLSYGNCETRTMSKQVEFQHQRLFGVTEYPSFLSTEEVGCFFSEKSLTNLLSYGFNVLLNFVTTTDPNGNSIPGTNSHAKKTISERIAVLGLEKTDARQIWANIGDIVAGFLVGKALNLVVESGSVLNYIFYEKKPEFKLLHWARLQIFGWMFPVLVNYFSGANAQAVSIDEHHIAHHLSDLYWHTSILPSDFCVNSVGDCGQKPDFEKQLVRDQLKSKDILVESHVEIIHRVAVPQVNHLKFWDCFWVLPGFRNMKENLVDKASILIEEEKKFTFLKVGETSNCTSYCICGHHE